MLTPILLPVVEAVGIDPVLFGIVMSIVVTMGILTPPVGVAMYIVNGILGVLLQEYLKESLPFIAVILLVIGIILAMPQIILFLPNALYR